MSKQTDRALDTTDEAASQLINLPFEDACLIKWQRGRAKYGEEFVGHPLEQLFGELVDGKNYCDEATRQGYDVEWIPETLRRLALRVQKLHRIHAEMDSAIVQPPRRDDAQEVAAC